VGDLRGVNSERHLILTISLILVAGLNGCSGDGAADPGETIPDIASYQDCSNSACLLLSDTCGSLPDVAISADSLATFQEKYPCYGTFNSVAPGGPVASCSGGVCVIE